MEYDSFGPADRLYFMHDVARPTSMPPATINNTKILYFAAAIVAAGIVLFVTTKWEKPKKTRVSREKNR